MLGIPNLGWLKEIGASPFDTILILFGFLFAAIVFLQARRVKADAIEKDKYYVKRLDAHAADIKEVRRLYHQLDKLTFGHAIAIKRATGIDTIKMSANGEGDHALNRDV